MRNLHRWHIVAALAAAVGLAGGAHAAEGDTDPGTSGSADPNGTSLPSTAQPRTDPMESSSSAGDTGSSAANAEGTIPRNAMTFAGSTSASPGSNDEDTQLQQGNTRGTTQKSVTE